MLKPTQQPRLSLLRTSERKIDLRQEYNEEQTKAINPKRQKHITA